MFNDVKFTFDDAAGRRLGIGRTALCLSSELPLEPPHSQADDRGEHSDDAAQHNECDETQYHRDPDCQSAHENDEDVRDWVSSGNSAIGR